MATIENPHLEGDLSDQEDFNLEVYTPDTPLTPASPKKIKKCREKYLTCPYPNCDKAFNRPARLEEHKRSHTNDRIFKCLHEGCTKDFLRQTHLKRHIEANHIEGPKNYVCKYEGCGQSFVTNQRLQRHHAVHTKRDQYTCSEPGCGATFRKRNTLDQHKRVVHLGQAACPCDVILEDGTTCPKGYGNAYQLKIHKGRDHGGRSYSCTICPADSGSAFGTYSDLQTHIKLIHPPICETCGYQAKTEKEVLSHIQNKHSGDTLSSRQTHICPFPECGGKGFVHKKNLKIHISSIHEGRKPFICGDTALSFNHVSGWDPTTSCGRAFSHKASLENHIRVMHMGLKSTQKPRPPKRKAGGTLDVEPSNKKFKSSALDFLTGTSMTQDSRRTIPCPILGCEYTFMREWDKAVHLHARHGVDVEDEWIINSRNNEHDEYNEAEDEDDDDYDNDDDDDDEYDVNPAMQMNPWSTQEIAALAQASAEEALEASAAEGGQFWVGGIDPAIHTDFGYDDNEKDDGGEMAFDAYWNEFGDEGDGK